MRVVCVVVFFLSLSIFSFAYAESINVTVGDQPAGTQVSGDLNKTLMNAADSGNVAMVEQLLGQGANPNYMQGDNGQEVTSDGYTVLMTAAHQGRAEVVKVLLAKGADINRRDSDGTTALIEAATEGYPEIVELLIASGADINVRTVSGDTALSWVLRYAKNNHNSPNYVQIIKILKEHSARE